MGRSVSQVVAGLLGFIVASMVVIGFFVIVFRIVTSRFFLNLSALLAIVVLSLCAVLIGLGDL
jgi:hypothetical protein